MLYSADRPLDITRLAIALQSCGVGHTVDYHESTASTMQIAHQLANDPATRSGTVVVAEEQSEGMGRMNRRWEAPNHSSLLMSLIIKSPQLPASPSQLPMMAGIAIVRALLAVEPELTDEVGLKWPNDVLLGEDLASGHKVAGVLIETAFRLNTMEYAIVGMGINVHQQANELPVLPAGAPPATSLATWLGRGLERPVDRTALMIALCTAWDKLLSRRERHDIHREWRNLLYTLGQPVTVATGRGAPHTIITGVAIDVGVEGDLLVQDQLGHIHSVNAGDVTTRPPG
jgi:BirA family biotin operon repressor/biotin-[acetyl-CoA-carboxylase] ligase